jgi:hypothetical protein
MVGLKDYKGEVNKMKFSEKLVEANKVLDWAKEFFEQAVFTEYTNIKLYDISSNFKAEEYVRKEIIERMNDDVWNEVFNQFCDLNFDDLNKYCDMTFGKPFMACVNHIGRTSSFYVRVNETFEIDDDYLDVINNVISYYAVNGFEIDDYLNDKNRFDISAVRNYFLNYEYREYIEEEVSGLIEVVDYIIEDMKRDILKDTEDTIKLWGYIDSFKSNQREYFSAFLENEFEVYPESFLSICPYCGEPSSKIGIDENNERCEHCGHYYDGRDLEFKLTADGEDVAIVGIEYDKLINSMFKEPVYKVESSTRPGNRFYALAKDIMIEKREDK